MWFQNPSVWLVVCGVLIVIAIMLYGMMKGPKQQSKLKPFKPTVSGYLSKVSADKIVDFITGMDQDEIRAVVILSESTFKSKQAQLERATELYSLIDERVFPELYEKVFKGMKGETADEDDLGGIFLSHYDSSRLEIYTMYATEVGEPVAVTDTRYNTQLQAADYIRKVYHKLKRRFGDYLVVVISGPNLEDLDQIVDVGSHFNDGETSLVALENEEHEAFGMYTNAMNNWLTHHPSGSSVDRYTRHEKRKIQNVGSVNSAMPPSTDYMPYDEEGHTSAASYRPAISEQSFNNYIRTTTNNLNVGGITTNRAEPFADSQVQEELDGTDVTYLE